MQALASYDTQQHSTVQVALTDLEDPPCGLVRARLHFVDRGTYVKFMWADWPEDLSANLGSKIEAFLGQHPELRPLDKDSEVWWAVFAGETDEEAAAEIGKRLLAHFPARVHWVVAERNGRGKVVAWSLIEGLGEILWDLSWRHVGAEPNVSAKPAVSRLSSQDVQKLNSAILDVYRWAEGRVKPILDALHHKLSSLYGDRFRGLYVFGSYARPDAGIELPEDSDLDVALLLSDMTNAYDEIKRFGSITSDLSSESGFVVSVIPIRETDFREGTTNFTRVISEYAIPWNEQGNRLASEEGRNEAEGVPTASRASLG
jgi:uncharacterized protein